MAAMTSASNEKWRTLNFFQSRRAKDLSAPLYMQRLISRRLYEDRLVKKKFQMHILYFLGRGLWLLEEKKSAYRNLVGKRNECRPLRRSGYRYKNNIKTGVTFDEQAWIGPMWSRRGLRGWLF